MDSVDTEEVEEAVKNGCGCLLEIVVALGLFLFLYFTFDVRWWVALISACITGVSIFAFCGGGEEEKK